MWKVPPHREPRQKLVALSCVAVGALAGAGVTSAAIAAAGLRRLLGALRRGHACRHRAALLPRLHMCLHGREFSSKAFHYEFRHKEGFSEGRVLRDFRAITTCAHGLHQQGMIVPTAVSRNAPGAQGARKTASKELCSRASPLLHSLQGTCAGMKRAT